MVEDHLTCKMLWSPYLAPELSMVPDGSVFGPTAGSQEDRDGKDLLNEARALLAPTAALDWLCALACLDGELLLGEEVDCLLRDAEQESGGQAQTPRSRS